MPLTTRCCETRATSAANGSHSKQSSDPPVEPSGPGPSWQRPRQARGYADDVKYVFSTNGHRYGEYDRFSAFISGPFSVIFRRTRPASRYAKDIGIDLTGPEAAILFQTDSPAWSESREYQDAAKHRPPPTRPAKARAQSQPSLLRTRGNFQPLAVAGKRGYCATAFLAGPDAA